jgi:hypothetical protein
MTDDKKQIVEQFTTIVNGDIDSMFDKEWTSDEVDGVIVKEVGNILGGVAELNNASADLKEGTIEAINMLGVVENKVIDLEKQHKLREELDIAA